MTQLQSWIQGVQAFFTRNQQVAVIDGQELEEYDEDEDEAVVVNAPVRPSQTSQGDTMVYTEGLSERLKNRSILVTGVIGSYLIAVILGFGNGYFFADFRFLSWEPWTLFSYLGGFLLEFIAINVLFKSSKHWAAKEYPQFALTFFVVLLFATGTIVTQYLMMQAQLLAHGIVITDKMVEQIPVLNVVVGIAGLHGAAGFLVFRAFMFHLGEIACVFLVPTKKPDIEETIKRNMEVSRHKAALVQQEGIQKVQASLDGMLQVAIQHMVANIANNVTQIQMTTPTQPTHITRVTQTQTPTLLPTPAPAPRQAQTPVQTQLPPPVVKTRINEQQVSQQVSQHVQAARHMHEDDIPLDQAREVGEPIPMIISKQRPSGGLETHKPPSGIRPLRRNA